MDVPMHHKRQAVCATRLPYRDGRVPKAVKVYTVNNESRYLLVQGVPSVGASKNLLQLFSKYGQVDEHHALDEYPCEDKYTEVYLFKYQKIQSARFAKRKLDDYSFFGGTLHVCYAPEHESVNETRDKLQERRRVIARKVAQADASKISVMSRQSTQVDTNSEKMTHSNDLEKYENRSVPELSYPLLQPPPPPPSSSFSNQIAINQNKLQEDIYQKSFVNRENQDDTHSRTFRTSSPWPKDPFTLSEPPRQVSQSMNRYQRTRGGEYSRVPSAHATLPAGFDGRLIAHVDNLETSPQQLDSLPSKSIPTAASPLIKVFKPKGPPPKFVPRQAIKRKFDSPHSTPNTDTNRPTSQTQISPDDNVNERLRQNAFKLGKVQGPENISTKKEIPIQVEPTIEKSMITTIKSIRSKISQVISDTVKKPPS